MENTEALRSFTRPKRKTLMGMRRSALGEIILMLAILLAVNIFWMDGTRYMTANPHPFWFVVLLIACKYGTKEGLIAAIASSIALLLGNMPEQTAEQDSYAYAMTILKLPLLWLVSAVIFGELRQMHIRERDQLETSLTDSEDREQRIAQSYQWVKELKDQLELRMAGQLRSSISAYHAAKNMESLSPTQVLRGLEELVTTTLHPEQFSIYSLSNSGLDVTLSNGWKDTDAYTRHFSSGNSLYQAIIARREVLCVANADHERLLSGQGMLAGPLVDKDSGQVVGMLKVEKLGFTDLHLSNIEAFMAICEWAGMAIVNARKYQDAKESSVTNPDHNLLTFTYFKRYADHISQLAARVGFDVSMVGIRLANAEQLDADTRARIARVLADAVDSVLRNVDLAFDHQEHSEEFSIVLPATDRRGAQIVLEKIRSALNSRVSKITKNADFTYSVQSIYEKRAA
jgi:polysaccharide biosynthesis protein PelD